MRKRGREREGGREKERVEMERVTSELSSLMEEEWSEEGGERMN